MKYWLSIPFFFCQIAAGQPKKVVCVREADQVRLIYEVEQLRAYRVEANTAIVNYDSLLALGGSYERLIASYRAEALQAKARIREYQANAQKCLQVNTKSIEALVQSEKRYGRWRKVGLYSLGANVVLIGGLAVLLAIR